MDAVRAEPFRRFAQDQSTHHDRSSQRFRRDNSMSHGTSRAATLEASPVETPAAEASSPSAQLPALPRYPCLFQINTRVWLTALARDPGRRATLDDIPDAELDRLAELGFDWIWL